LVLTLFGIVERDEPLLLPISGVIIIIIIQFYIIYVPSQQLQSQLHIIIIIITTALIMIIIMIKLEIGMSVALSQIHVHTKGYAKLHGMISKRILPSEYGGANGSRIDHWCK
jgi:hypothetical protein